MSTEQQRALKRVLVTGATGFLGLRTVDFLLEAGYMVRALVRGSSDTSALRERNVEIVVGSLEPAVGLDAAVSGVDAIVHSAGGGRAIGKDALFAANTETTRNLIEAAKRSAPQLERFVLVSSLAAHGPSDDGRPRDVKSPRRPVTQYGASKAAAETLALAEADALPVTVLRPPVIYGPGDARILPLFKWAARGVVPLPSIAESASMVHVDDCARAILRILETPHPSGRIYFVEDGSSPAMSDVIGAIGAAVGRTRRPRRLPLPRALLLAAAALVSFFARLLRRPAMLNSDKVRDLTQRHWVCDSEPIQRELGWRPQVAFAEGARATAHWYRAQGLL
ncbi:MAG: NAD-dependent epimerase/dehydratase family protein [Myxococcales bacterium]|nr:NAD-dependent epimerase/dehydratase family protein [Myxococcales bacterium]